MQKWHPDKHKGDSAVTTKFQAINEAYTGILVSNTEENFYNDLPLVNTKWYVVRSKTSS